MKTFALSQQYLYFLRAFVLTTKVQISKYKHKFGPKA